MVGNAPWGTRVACQDVAALAGADFCDAHCVITVGGSQAGPVHMSCRSISFNMRLLLFYCQHFTLVFV